MPRNGVGVSWARCGYKQLHANKPRVATCRHTSTSTMACQERGTRKDFESWSRPLSMTINYINEVCYNWTGNMPIHSVVSGSAGTHAKTIVGGRSGSDKTHEFKRKFDSVDAGFTHHTNCPIVLRVARCKFIWSKCWQLILKSLPGSFRNVQQTQLTNQFNWPYTIECEYTFRWTNRMFSIVWTKPNHAKVAICKHFWKLDKQYVYWNKQ